MVTKWHGNGIHILSQIEIDIIGSLKKVACMDMEFMLWEIEIYLSGWK